LVEDFGDTLIEIECNNLFLFVLPGTALHVLHDEFDGVASASVGVKLVGSPIVAVPVPIEDGGHVAIVGIDFLGVVLPIAVFPTLVNHLAQIEAIIGIGGAGHVLHHSGYPGRLCHYFQDIACKVILIGQHVIVHPAVAIVHLRELFNEIIIILIVSVDGTILFSISSFPIGDLRHDG